MPLGETDISVSSQALVRLGDVSISAFDETFGGEQCGVIFPFVKEKVLISYPWRVTMIKSKILNQVAAEPNSEYRHAYTLPPDLLFGPRTVWDSPPESVGDKTPFKNFEIFGKQLLTDATFIKVDYQVDVDTDKLPSHIIELLVLSLKAEVAFVVTDQQNTADAARAEAWGTPQERMRGGYFAVASRIDAQTRPPSRQKTFPLTAVRQS